MAEIVQQSAKPLFGDKFVQPFFHSVNTFPKQCEVKVNGIKLQAGIDFIPDPGAHSAHGKFKLFKKDSLHFVSGNPPTAISLTLKKKLTYSVAAEVNKDCTIELDKTKFSAEPLDVELNIKSKLVNFESRNIGCFFPGASGSDSMIVFSAHYDHLGGLGNNVFFPGANDNASGVSLVLNLIRYYKQYPPKYKTVFIFFAAEEAGLIGSRFFVDSKTIDIQKIKFLINLDLLGTGDDGIMVVNGYVHARQFEQLNKINTEKQLVKEIKRRGKASNSDHYWFSEEGVPCFFIYTMGGPTAYHDVYDIERTLPLTDYADVFKLITEFVNTF